MFHELRVHVNISVKALYTGVYKFVIKDKFIQKTFLDIFVDALLSTHASQNIINRVKKVPSQHAKGGVHTRLYSLTIVFELAVQHFTQWLKSQLHYMGLCKPSLEINLYQKMNSDPQNIRIIISYLFKLLMHVMIAKLNKSVWNIFWYILNTYSYVQCTLNLIFVHVYVAYASVSLVLCKPKRKTTHCILSCM